MQRKEPSVRERPEDEAVQPRAEPEILPPDRSPPFRRGERQGPRVFIRAGNFRHFHVAKPGPLAIIVALLALGAGAVALVVFLLGAFLIALPVAGALALALIILGWSRRLR